MNNISALQPFPNNNLINERFIPLNPNRIYRGYLEDIKTIECISIVIGNIKFCGGFMIYKFSIDGLIMRPFIRKEYLC